MTKKLSRYMLTLPKEAKADVKRLKRLMHRRQKAYAAAQLPLSSAVLVHTAILRMIADLEAMPDLPSTDRPIPGGQKRRPLRRS